MVLKDRPGDPLRLAVAVSLLALVAVGHAQPASALDRSSTMADWSGASAADRKSLLEALGPSLTPSFKAKEDEILACVDSAGQSSAHADLLVAEIAKACAEAEAAPSGSGDAKDI